MANVNHIVSGFVKYHRATIPKPPITIEKRIIWLDAISPVADGLHAVRRILASTACSIKQLTAKAALASIQIPIVPPIRMGNGTMPGVAKNMPMMAQKTASIVTRGLVSTRYWRHFGIGLTADDIDFPDVLILFGPSSRMKESM